MSSTPLASTGAGPAFAVGPGRSASSREDPRADPISCSLSSQSSHASLSGEADNVANILGHASRLARLDPASFPTVYNSSATTFPDSQLAIAPLLVQLIAMVNDLGASVTFLTLQVETLTSSHIQPGGIPQGFVLLHCCTLLSSCQTSGSPAASGPASSRRSCSD